MFVYLFETELHWVVEDNFRPVAILLPHLPEYWNFRCEPPCLVYPLKLGGKNVFKEEGFILEEINLEVETL